MFKVVLLYTYVQKLNKFKNYKFYFFLLCLISDDGNDFMFIRKALELTVDSTARQSIIWADTFTLKRK